MRWQKHINRFVGDLTLAKQSGNIQAILAYDLSASYGKQSRSPVVSTTGLFYYTFHNQKNKDSGSEH